ncbi:DDT domain-containing protein PTM-like protein [Cinnamomum micranthum f. kanehirae]|uniref:DDT domain-containing protein PTM-like protein n=1 Tax=Cinnamomum micranthum f. kanehirae TaxID=337451 RepID=A0A3S3MWF3_9MAGN|nr:DDT domain-containing protein PTM-like protein [Cinnamomum micranthum f. kanehirae]
MELVGKAVKKTFQGLGTFAGIVDSYDLSSGFYKVLYEDGDSEDLERGEVISILEEADQYSFQTEAQMGGRERNSGNSSDTQMGKSGFSKGFEESVLKTLDVSFDGDSQVIKNDGCLEIQNKVFDIEGNTLLGSLKETTASSQAMEGSQEKQWGDNGSVIENDPSEFVVKTQMKDGDSDGVLNENCPLENVEVAQMKESFFGGDCYLSSSLDRNLKEKDVSRVIEKSIISEVDGKQKGSDSLGVVKKREREDSEFDGNVKENDSLGHIEDREVKGCDSDEFQMKESGSGVVLIKTPVTDGLRKRRKLSEKLKSAPERALRRSARHTSAASPIPLLDADNGQCVAVSESSEYEEQNNLPLKPVLPPSSNNLNIDELPILDVFSVYACLRSFSTILFLSPFGLEAFVKALKCNFANSLIDSIHFSILHALKLHLEFLSNEGSHSASDCLRSLNWDLLDLITWPVYLAEYLLIHGSGLKPSFNLCHLKLLDGEYYRQTAAVKLEILRSLCDDVIEVEAVRLELNRRMMSSELDIDTDRVVHLESHSKRKDSTEDLGSSCLTQDVVDEIADRNSDDCCLCKMDGSLICCDGCPAAYHSRCVGVTKDLLPEGDWFCPECMVDKHDGQIKSSKPLQGAQLLGIDPHGRLYFGCCGYLLVSDSSDSELSHYYYNRNDLSAVMEVLKSSLPYYSGISMAISTYWGILAQSTEIDFGHKTHVAHMDLDVVSDNCGTDLSCQPPAHSAQSGFGGMIINGKEPKKDSVTHEDSGFQGCKDLDSIARIDSMSVNQLTDMSTPIVISEGSAMSEAAVGMPVSEKTYLELGIPEKLYSINEELSVKPADVDITQGKPLESAPCAPITVTIPSKQDVSQLPVEPGSYINYYSHGQLASSVVEELTRRSSENIKEDSTRPPEEVISAQLKAISKKSSKFSWSIIQKPYVDAEKENCGWCFSCKNPSDSNCLFRLTDEKAAEGSKMSVGLRSNRNRKTHLSSVIYHIISIEDRLRGLLSGPWENPHHSKQWHKSILKASDVSSVKPLLLILESNLRRVALSAEWLKQVDSAVALGSGSHVFTSSVHVSSKHGFGKKRARKNASDTESNFLSNAATMSGIYWWRGGRLSRQVFQWKLLPRSLAFKCGRRAGCIKVPGVSYPDGSDFAKISKHIAWRASVQMSTSAAQLALHVRDLDWNIRWSDLVNPQLLHQSSKESKKLARLFKKVVIRRKCIEGSNVKYLLDFGKRKVIPDVVTKHGVVFEESANERKKFWLGESFVPLNLLKSYEEKKQARKANKTEFGLLLVEGGKIKKPSSERGFSYLFSRAEKHENHQCGHCNKDVSVREAVNCQLCTGFFHKKHARASKVSIDEECTYTCFRCRAKKPVEVKTRKHAKGKTKREVQKVQSEGNKIPKVGRREVQKVQSEGNKIPQLRRSQRAIKKVTTYVAVQSKNLNGHKKGSKFLSKGTMAKTSKFLSKSGKSKKSKFQSKRETPKELKNGVSWHKGQRTCVHHAYWMKGILWAKSPCDRRGINFRDGNVLLPSQNSEDKQPVCCLCHEAYDSRLIYLRCESCEDWYHGDAFGLTGKNSDKPLGFRCPNCLKRSSPACPHSKDCAVDEAQLHWEENIGMGTECARDPCEDNKLPSEIYGGQRLVKDEDSPAIHDSGTSNENVKLENCIAESEMGSISVTSEVKENHLSCKSNGEDIIQIGVVLKEHKLEDSLAGISTIP